MFIDLLAFCVAIKHSSIRFPPYLIYDILCHEYSKFTVLTRN